MNELAAPSKLQPALIGGVVLGVLSAVPLVNALNCFCCLWVIAGGLLATYLYQNKSPLPVQYGDGAVLGLLTGVFGAIVETIIGIPLQLLGLGLAAGAMQDALQQLESNPDIPPEFVELVRSFMTEGGLAATGIAYGLLFHLVIFAIFATIGAIIGVAIFQKRAQGAATPPAAPPPTAPPPSAPPSPPAE